MRAAWCEGDCGRLFVTGHYISGAQALINEKRVAMSKFAVLVTAPSVSDQARTLLRDAGAEILYMKNPLTEQALVAEFARRKIEVVLPHDPTPFTPAVFAAATDLRIISKHGAGIDTLDLDAATTHGVAVMVTNGANADAVAEHAQTQPLHAILTHVKSCD